MIEKIQKNIPGACPWKDTLQWFPTIDSTNTFAKTLAAQGAPEGTVIIAGYQSGGRGRLGRSFDSREGMGVYLSVILRPCCPPENLLHLTCAAAVAMVQAIGTAAGIEAGIKWTNDLVWQKRKLGGILTELGLDPETGLVSYAVIGIGINCLQHPEDFPPDIRDMAASLSMASGKPILPEVLAGAIIGELYRMRQNLWEKSSLMMQYRKSCITLGQQVSVHRGDQVFYGEARDLDENGSLLLVLSDGTKMTVGSGEVSIRGMYGYC